MRILIVNNNTIEVCIYTIQNIQSIRNHPY